jgi:hypothetical protein
MKFGSEFAAQSIDRKAVRKQKICGGGRFERR